jgi:L-lactate dehydrogenase complex protein LldG
MKNAREKILSQIRASLHRGSLTQEQEGILNQRMKERSRGVLPRRADGTQEQLLTLFIEQARLSLARVERINYLSQAPKLIAQILQPQLPLVLRTASEPQIQSLPWNQYSELTVKYGAAEDGDKASVTLSLCGVAETGTVVFSSSPANPTTLNFLPEIHFALLSTRNIVAYYEDAWDWLRAKKQLPRTVNFITGPSRTADIEQTVQIGIHGPKQFYIVLYEEEKSS